MFKRLVAASLFVAVLANAQDDYDWEDSSANSGSAQTEQAAQPMAATSSSDDYSMSVSIHPISMGILTLVGIPSIVATVENNLGARLSLVTRPELVWMDLEDDGGSEGPGRDELGPEDHLADVVLRVDHGGHHLRAELGVEVVAGHADMALELLEEPVGLHRDVSPLGHSSVSD